MTTPKTPFRAWTGGKSDYRAHRDNALFRATRRAIFRDDIISGGVPLDYWACSGTSALQKARIHWNRARLDAMATLNLN